MKALFGEPFTKLTKLVGLAQNVVYLELHLKL